MIGYLEFILITFYMVVTYHIIALKYKASFQALSRASRTFLVALHVFIVISNIFLYFWLILSDFNQIPIALRAAGIFIFAAGLFILFWGSYALRKAVFVPGNKLLTKGPFAVVRHPMYLGGITGAFGLALFAGSLFAMVYSFILALVLSRIAEAEEENLIAKFGKEYEEYKRKVPKLLPHAW